MFDNAMRVRYAINQIRDLFYLIPMNDGICKRHLPGNLRISVIFNLAGKPNFE